MVGVPCLTILDLFLFGESFSLLKLESVEGHEKRIFQFSARRGLEARSGEMPSFFCFWVFISTQKALSLSLSHTHTHTQVNTSQPTINTSNNKNKARSQWAIIDARCAVLRLLTKWAVPKQSSKRASSNNVGHYDSSNPRTPSPSPRTPSPRTLKFQREDRKLCRVLDGLFYDSSETELEMPRYFENGKRLRNKWKITSTTWKTLESLDVLRDSKSSDESTKEISSSGWSVLELVSCNIDVRDEIDERWRVRCTTHCSESAHSIFKGRTCHAIEVFGSRGQSNLMKPWPFVPGLLWQIVSVNVRRQVWFSWTKCGITSMRVSL